MKRKYLSLVNFLWTQAITGNKDVAFFQTRIAKALVDQLHAQSASGRTKDNSCPVKNLFVDREIDENVPVLKSVEVFINYVFEATKRIDIFGVEHCFLIPRHKPALKFRICSVDGAGMILRKGIVDLL